MIRGIIYKYTSPSGKVYIGQTINEKDRRKHFLIQKLSYGGIKIDTARAKYNPENFKYEILETRFNRIKRYVKWIDRKEWQKCHSFSVCIQ